MSVLADVRDISKKLGSVDSQLSGFGKTTKKLGGLLAGAFAGTAVVSGIKTMVSSASDLNETISKTETIFGKSGADIIKWSKTTAGSMGLSQQAALDGVSTFGNFFNQIGIGAKETEKMSKGFIQASVDLGSFHNAAPTDVMDALAAATRGEYDSLQKFIPTINAAKVEMEAMRVTGKESAKELTDQDKARAVSALVMKGQGKAAGDFARTQGSLANQMKIVKASISDIVANLGTALLPIVTKVAAYIVDTVIPKFTEWGNIFKDKVLPAIKDVGNFLKDNLMPPLTALGDFMKENPAVVATFVGVILTVVAAMKIWAAVQAALNIVMSANPLGLIVIAIAAFVAALVYAYKNSETFKNIVDKAFSLVKTVVMSVVNWITSNVPQAFDKIKGAAEKVFNWVKSNWKLLLGIITGPIGAAVLLVITHWDTIKEKTTAAFNTVKGVITGAWNTVKNKTSEVWAAVVSTIADKIESIKNKVDSIKDKVTGAFSGAATWLTQAGKDVIAGLVAGLESAKQWVIDKIQEIADTIPGWVKKRLGIASPSKVMKALGKFISEGLALGIEEGGAAVSGVMSDISSKVADFYENKYPKSKKAAKEATTAFLGSIKDEGAALRANLTAQLQNSVALKDAMVVLEDARKKVTDYAAAVTSATVAYGGLIGLGKKVDEEGVVTITSATIIDDLGKKVIQAQEFATLIGQLTAQGLNVTNLDQLIQSGVDGGLATAQALAAGGPEAIAQINAMTAQLQAVGVSMGSATANTMYGAGVQAAEGLVLGFESIADKLELAGDNLAKKLLKAIRKALKVASPSKATKEMGKFVGLGLVAGIKSTSGLIEKAGSQMARDVEAGFTAPRLSLDSNAVSRGPVQPVITINVNGSVVDGAKEGKKIQSYLDSYYKSGGTRLAL